MRFEFVPFQFNFLNVQVSTKTEPSPYQPLLANPGKIIQKIFRNLSFSGHESDRITGKLIQKTSIELISWNKFSLYTFNLFMSGITYGEMSD